LINEQYAMQKLNLTQTLQQKLSPQQIQFIKLLQIPTVELDTRIQEELDSNPLLEMEDTREDFSNSESLDVRDNSSPSSEMDSHDSSDDLGIAEEYAMETRGMDDLDMGDYISPDDVAGYKMYGDGNFAEEDDREMPIVMMGSLIESLEQQLGYLKLDDRLHAIGMQLIGSIDGDGYIRRDLGAIVNDLAFREGIETSLQELELVLKKIQMFDPPGIAARTLQECLEIQLKRKEIQSAAVKNAIKLISLSFDEFTKKHYKRIQKKLNITEDDLKDAIALIVKLNPKPGDVATDFSRSAHYLIPDFILKEEMGKMFVTLNSKNAPELRISRGYADLIDAYQKSDKKDKRFKEQIAFVKQKLEAAKWFIDAIKQRQDTLLRTMRAIVSYQHDFFVTGDESKLRPMILKDIADLIGMDISTVSRVANSKSVQTDFGIYPLKYFFSESITTETGEDVSSKEVKHILKQIIEGEDKDQPLSDDRLEKMLRDKGYNIARRTVAKYREQLNIPVARLRKELN
jgi:RNA polymerase sigma-54 factor